MGAVVGFAVGDVVGRATGDVVGRAVGGVVGRAVGAAVGLAVGSVVGRAVGGIVGRADGAVVGTAVGDAGHVLALLRDVKSYTLLVPSPGTPSVRRLPTPDRATDTSIDSAAPSYTYDWLSRSTNNPVAVL